MTHYLAVGAAIIIGLLAFDTWRLEQKIDGLQAENAKLAIVAAERKAALEAKDREIAANQAELDALGTREGETQRQTEKLNAELESMRATLMERAIAAPFDLGNDAAEHMSGWMRRIENRGDPGKPAADHIQAAPIGGAGADR